MAFLRFTRDSRGYENFYLVEATTNRRGKTRSRVLYWFRTPPHVKVGRDPFDPGVREVDEQQNPDVEFDWRKILDTPIPSADAEKWRERRRLEKAEKAARRAAEVAEPAPEDPTAAVLEPLSAESSNELAAPDSVPDPAAVIEPPEDVTEDDRPPHVLEAAAAAESAAPASTADAGRRRRRRRRRSRGGRPPEGSAPPVDSAP